ncbi:MAG TPA: sterol desaturase family protein [Burkholderiaceae bacterium]
MPDNNALIAAATPVFFAMIALEVLLARRRQADVYHLADSLTSVGCGIWTVTLEVFIKAGLLAAYAWLAQHAALWHFEARDWRTWLLFFVVLDFLYYWAHRWSHEINLLWGGHAPHHQSARFNFTTALRQGVLQDALHMPVLLPLAVLGCPPGVFITLLTLSKFYQFWIHTELIRTVPLVEGVLNTPSAHRVHHAVNDQYLDKNYGGTLMLWDRLFGTWRAETEACVYGVRKGASGWSAVRAQTVWLAGLGQDALAAKRWRDKLQIWWRRTGWRPADVAARTPDKAFDLDAARIAAPARGGWWSAAAVALCIVAAALNHLLLSRLSTWQTLDKIALAAGVTAALLAMAWALEPVHAVTTAAHADA